MAKIIKVRKDVLNFSKEMEKKLRIKDYKGGWEECRLDCLFAEIGREIHELMWAMQKADTDTIRADFCAENCEDIISECADIANYVMMIATNTKRRMKKKKSDG